MGRRRMSNLSSEPETREWLAQARVLVTGMGATGQACVTYLNQYAGLVTTYDDGGGEADILSPEDLNLADIDLIVTSPGLPPHHPVLAEAMTRGVPVWSEIELAWRARVPNAKTGKPAPWLPL